MRLLIRHFFLLLLFSISSKELNAQQYPRQKSVYDDSIFISGYYIFSIDPKKIRQERNRYERLPVQKKFRLNYCLGLRAIQEGKWERAELYLNKCLLLNRKQHQRNRELALVTYYFYLSSQFQEKPYEVQLRYLLQADSLILTDFDKEHFGSIRQGIIETFRIQGKLDQAVNWINDTRAVYAKKKQPESELIWIVSAAVYAQLGNRAGNNHYYYKALRLLQRFQNNHFRFERPFYKTRVYTEMGACYSGLNNSEKAIAYFEKAIQLNKEMGDKDATILQQINLLNEEGKLKHHRKVISMGIELLKDSSNAELKNRLAEVYFNIGKSYVAIGDYKTANSYYQKHLYSKELLLKSEYSNQLDELDARYKTTQKEAEIARISALRKHELSQKKIVEKERNMLFWVAIIVGILLLVVFLFAYRFSLAKKRIEVQSKELSTNNLQLAELIRDKEFLFKELHHRVKNNFQLVVGFLRLQEKYAGSQSIEQFIRQSEMKLNAMAMVHEMLYREQTNELVDIRQYLHNLGESIIGTASVIDVEFFCEGDTAFLPIDKAIPIGLTTNEIIFNSLKHAGQEEITIRITVHKIEDRLLIEISDDGDGFTADFDPATSNSLGVKAIQLLMEQIGGTTEWKNDHGAHWFLKIPLQKTPQYS